MIESKIDNNIEPTDVPKPKGIVVHTRWQQVLLSHLMVIGPGLIVMGADNDAGAVSTYTQAGAQYGLHLLWILVLLLPVCYFIQEMVARLGIATGEGHAAMIFKRFGKWWGRFSIADLMLVNFLTLVTEFAGISIATARMGISPWLTVPVSAAALVALVLTGSYLRWERITIGLVLLDLFWVVMAVAAHPGAKAVVYNTFVPNTPHLGWTSDLVFLVIAIVGTTIAPWQLFFQQSAVADKKLRFSDLKSARIDTFGGSVVTVVVAGSMMCVGNAMYQHHLSFSDAGQMAVALKPILGSWMKYAILLFMINAAVLGTTSISLASAWAYSEVRNWPHSLQLPFKEAKGFYLTYIICTFLAAGIVLIPRAPLQLIIVGVQVLAGMMLPSAIIFLQLLLNDKELLGERFVNKPWNNVVNWIIVTILFVLSLVLAVQVIAPNLVAG